MTLSGPPRDQARLVSAQEPRMTCLLSAAHWARDTHVSPHVYLCCPGECGPAPTPAPPPRTAPPPTRPHCAPARPRGCCCPAPRALEDVVTTCHVSRVSAAHLTRPRARGRGCAGGRAPGGRQPAPAAGRRPGPGRRSCQWPALGHGSTVYIQAQASTVTITLPTSAVY